MQISRFTASKPRQTTKFRNRLEIKKAAMRLPLFVIAPPNLSSRHMGLDCCNKIVTVEGLFEQRSIEL